MSEKICTLCTAHTITIYWDRQVDLGVSSRNGSHLDDGDGPGCFFTDRFEIRVDGRLAGTTDRTHFTLEGLKPDREYRIEVWFSPEVGAASGQRGDHLPAPNEKSGRKTGSTEGKGSTESAKNAGSTESAENAGSTADAGGVLRIGSVTVRTEKCARRKDVTAFGAVGDGKTMNTEALQKIFDECQPGEEVYFPAGIYRTGALRLHSDMILYLEKNAILQGTDDPEDYLPYIRSRFEGTEMECYSSLLNLGFLDHEAGPNCENVRIYGNGTIASGGQTLGMRVIERETQRMKDYLTANPELVASCETDHTIPGRLRPRLINLSNCRNVRISGLTLANGACWNVHMIYCDSIVTDHCTFRSEGVWNGDGWDPDSSTNCTLFASEFFTGDDAVAIKSGKNPEGNLIARPSAHIRVFDCVSQEGHGICMGSEMSGGIEDVRIWDCDLTRAMSGLEIKATKKRGGYVRDIYVQDCVIPRVMMHSVGYNDDGIPAPTPPIFSHCVFERLTLTGRYLDTHGDGQFHDCDAITLAGFDVPGYEIQDVTFRDIRLEGGPKAVEVTCCKDVYLENVR